MGDVGGIIEIFTLVLGMILNPFNKFGFDVKAIHDLFLIKTEDKSLFELPKV